MQPDSVFRTGHPSTAFGQNTHPKINA